MANLGTRTTAQQRKQIVENYTQDMSATAIAKHHGLTTKGVTNILRRVGVRVDSQRRRPKVPVSAAQRADVRRRYKSGATLDEVSVATGLSVWVVRRVLGRTKRRKANKRLLFTGDSAARSEIVSRYGSGESINWLAEWFGCSSPPIRRVLTEEGIEIRNQRQSCGFTFRDRRDRVFFFRSSWEAKTAAWFDMTEELWDYEVEEFRLDDCGYLPDFWVYDERGNVDYLVEVKGWLSPQSAAKLDQFRAQYSHIRLELWRESQLTDRGILALRPDTFVDHRFRTRMRRSVRKQIITLYQSGLTAREVGLQVGRAKPSVLRVLHIAGIVRSVSEAKLFNSEFTPSDRNKAERLYRTGLSLNRVAKKIGVPMSTVYDELRKRDVVRRKVCQES